MASIPSSTSRASVRRAAPALSLSALALTLSVVVALAASSSAPAVVAVKADGDVQLQVDAGLFQTDLSSRDKWWEVSSKDNAESLWLFFDRESRRYFVYREGHITSSRKALEMYFEIARSPLIENICEVGFNAGHSTWIYLNANPRWRVWSWDLGQFDYTLRQADLARRLFPDRFFLTLGDSGFAIPEFHRRNPHISCDLFSVDGDHSTEGTYQDLKNFREMASCRNWVLMDDAGWNSTNTWWQQAKDDGVITQVECFWDMAPVPNYQFMDFPDNRSWCLGFFNVEVDKDGNKCDKWYEGNVNEGKTRIRPIEFAWEQGR